MRLTKHHGLGNDFLVLLDLDGIRPVSSELAQAICDRRHGVGADGLMRVTGGAGDADVTMHLFNSDGSRAEMSGNGIRCLAQAVFNAGLAAPPVLRVMTDAGLRTVTEHGRPARGTSILSVDMGSAKVGEEEPEWVADDVLRAVRVDVGNPHLVLHIADPDHGPDIAEIGRAINAAVPGGINVELLSLGPGDDELTMSVYERGAGVTLACGTGAIAVAAAARSWELAGDRAIVHMPGGPVGVTLGDPTILTGPSAFVAVIDWRDQ